MYHFNYLSFFIGILITAWIILSGRFFYFTPFRAGAFFLKKITISIQEIDFFQLLLYTEYRSSTKKKPGKTAIIMLQKPRNTKKIIFAETLKPFGHRVISFYMVDVLLSATVPLSISQIRKEVHRISKINYSGKAFRAGINCLANMQNITLHVTEKKAGDAVAKFFSITISNNQQNELFKDI